MNYLAHFAMSNDDSDVLVGNFIADAVKGRAFGDFDRKVKTGILLHRAIDHFTDTHPLYIASKRYFYTDFPKVSGVICDILFDHLLAKNWDKFYMRNYQFFKQKTYAELSLRRNDFPVKMNDVYEHMVKNDWLQRYLTEEGTNISLIQILTRINYPLGNKIILDVYLENCERINENFMSFYHELQVFGQKFLIDGPA